MFPNKGLNPRLYRQCLLFHTVMTVFILLSGQGILAQHVSDSTTDNDTPASASHVDIAPTPSSLRSRVNGSNPNNTQPIQITMLTKRPVILLDLNSGLTVTMNFTLQCDHPSSVYVVSAKSVTTDVATIVAGNPVKISCTFGVIAPGLNGAKNNGRNDSSGSDLIGQKTDYNKNNNKNNNNNNKNNNNNDNNNDNNDIVSGKNTNVEDQNSVKTGTANSKTDIVRPSNKSFEISGQFEMRFQSHRIGRSFFLMFAIKVQGPDTNPQTFPSYGSSTASANKSTTTNNNKDGLARNSNQGIHLQLETLNDSSIHSGSFHPSRGHRPAPPSPRQGRPQPVVKSMIIVMKLPGPVDKIFRIVLYVVIITATIGMGIKVEFDVVLKVMKKPLGPFIGLFCQYVCMPLIAYVIAQTIPQPSAAISLGIFTCGIVPGGGASNFWCYLLGGDVTLSVTMTTISSIVALGFIPMWLFTLGQNFKDDTAEIHVPYTKILETLAIVLLPVFAGMLLKRKVPKLAELVSKILKPFLIVIVLFLLAVGIYANYFIFAMIRPMQILAGCLLPYVGYVIGGGIALLARLSWVHVKTIAIETGIQNTGIAFMIVFFSFPPPDNQLAVVAPAASAIMTPLPLIVVTFFYTLYTRHRNKMEAERALVDQSEEGKMAGKDLNENTNPSSILEKEADPRRKTKRSLWERVLGKGSGDDGPDMEEMLNQEVMVKGGT